MSKPVRWAVGANAVAVSVIVVLISAVLSEIAQQQPYRLDLSADGTMTLDPDTEAAVALAHDRHRVVTITAFSAQAKDEAAWARDRMLKDFLAALADRSDSSLETRFVDFDSDRLTAERLGVDRYGTVVVQSDGDRVDVSDRDLFRIRGPKGQKEVSFIGEAAVGAAIRKVISPRRGVVVSLSGHGERELYDRGLGELRGLASLIEAQGVGTRTVNLVADAAGTLSSVPADAEVVLLLGPNAPLAPAEIDALRDFVRRGGGIGVFVEGSPPAFLADLGVSIGQGAVLDPISQFPNPDRPVLGYGVHPITEGLAQQGVSTVVSVAVPVEVTAIPGLSTGTLLKTSRQGWIERGQESPAVYDSSVDGAGPAVVGVAVTATSPHAWSQPGSAGRVVVIGDVDMVLDELMTEGPGNRTFLTNVVRWLIGRDEPFTQVGRPSTLRLLQLGTAQLGVIRALLVVFVPLLVSAMGAAVLYSRRQR